MGVLVLLTGCGDEKVTSYRVPKEKDPELPPAAAGAAAAPAPDGAGPSMAQTAVPTAEGPGLAWTAPSSWTPKAASAMRKASYSVAGEGDLSVTAFPGDVGGELANVNRWRDQVGLPPLEAAGLEAAVSRLDANGLAVVLVELAAADGSGKAILGAIVPFGGSTWFFKLTGPAPVVSQAKPDFLTFVRTIHPA